MGAARLQVAQDIVKAALVSSVERRASAGSGAVVGAMDVVGGLGGVERDERVAQLAHGRLRRLSGVLARELHHVAQAVDVHVLQPPRPAVTAC